MGSPERPRGGMPPGTTPGRSTGTRGRRRSPPRWASCSVRGGQDARGSASSSKPGGERSRRRRRDSGDSRRRRGRRVLVASALRHLPGVGDDADVARAGGGALEPPRVRRRHVHVRLDRTPGGSAPRWRAFHAAAHCSEEGRDAGLLLRAAPAGRERPRRRTGAPPPRSERSRRRPALQNHRDEFSPGPLHERLLCGTAGGGGPFVIPSAAFLAAKPPRRCACGAS